jgi:hypothetical protein
MSIIKLPLHFEGSKGEKTLNTLFNFNATFSCINQEQALSLGTPENLWNPLRVETISEVSYLEIKQRISLDFYIDDIRLSDEFYIIPTLSEEAILGVNTFQKWRIKFDFESDKVIVDPKVAKATLK